MTSPTLDEFQGSFYKPNEEEESSLTELALVLLRTSALLSSTVELNRESVDSNDITALLGQTLALTARIASRIGLNLTTIASVEADYRKRPQPWLPNVRDLRTRRRTNEVKPVEQ